MPFRLTKEELKKKQEIVQSLQGLSSELESILNTYNEALREAEAFRDVVFERLRGEFEEKSEKWQESEVGSTATEMIDAWENANFGEDVEPDINHSTILEDLPEGAS